MAARSDARRRAAALVLLTATAALAVASWPAAAQVEPIVGSSTTTTAGQTTTTAPASTTTTAAPAPTAPTTSPSSTSSTSPPTTSSTQPPPGLAPPPSETTTTTAPRAAPPPPPPPTAGGGDGDHPPPGGEFPPELQALTNSVRRSRGNNTRALLDALAPLRRFGVSEVDGAVLGFGRFPVAGYASYVHDWWFPRFGPGWRLHEGTDIFAAHGTPVRAPVDGHVRITNGGLGGLAVYVIQPDGTYWYLAHLAATPEGMVDGQVVRTGQVVGFVGDSGNARGGLPHVHFEIHPRGGGPIDPKPVLDQFLADAVAIAPRLVESYAAHHAARTGSRQAVAAAAVPTPPVPAVAPRAALLWASAVNPTGGALQLAEAEVARVAAGLDWEALAAAREAKLAAFRQAERTVSVLLAPLVPPQMAILLG